MQFCARLLTGLVRSLFQGVLHLIQPTDMPDWNRQTVLELPNFLAPPKRRGTGASSLRDERPPLCRGGFDPSSLCGQSCRTRS